MITKIEIENFKSIEKATVELGKFNVLIGPNNSGKSNFLEAIMLSQKLASICDLREIFKERRPFKNYLWRDSKHIKLSLEMKENASVRYDVILQKDGNGNPFFDTEQISAHEGSRRLLSTFRSSPGHIRQNDPNIYFSEITLEQSTFILIGERGKRHSTLLKLKDAFNSFRVYRFMPNKFHEVSKIVTGVQPPEFSEDGLGLPSILMYYRTQDSDRFEEIEKTLNEHFPFIKRINLTPTEMRNDEGQTLTGTRITFRDRFDKIFESNQISDGVMLLLAFITVCKSNPPPALIAIEEPENGIHPSNLELAIKFMREMVDKNENTQVILTTHSPYLLDLVKPEEVFIFNRDGDGPTEIFKMTDVPNIENKLRAFMLGEFWTDMGEKKLTELIKGSKK